MDAKEQMAHGQPSAMWRATYRLQLSPSFGFDDAADMVPYLAALGISHLYLSPIFKARPGSSHGYDAVDLSELNPALGGRAGFERLSAVARGHDLGLIVDFVPNHMGVSTDNPWWESVLEWGRASPYASYFDIDWKTVSGQGDGRIRLPVLGAWFRDIMNEGQLGLEFDRAHGRFALHYFDHRFPVAAKSYLPLLRQTIAAYPEARSVLGPITVTIADAVGRMAVLPGDEKAAALFAEAKGGLIRAAEDGGIAEAIEQTVAQVKSPAAGARSVLQEIIAQQAYRLSYWRAGSETVSYRRFFDIDDLIGMCVEEPFVFDAMHDGLIGLVRDGHVQGLRLDHIDGLRDPEGYLNRLHSALQGALREGGQADTALPVFVEKILAADETLPETWPVAGTTGYDFLNQAGVLFIDREAEAHLGETARRRAGAEGDFAAIVRAAKQALLGGSLRGDLNRITGLFADVLKSKPIAQDIETCDLRDALARLIVELDVYRTYLRLDGASETDVERWRGAVSRAAGTADYAQADAPLHAVAAVIDTALGGAELPGVDRQAAADAVMGLQQMTGAVMAKSVEDTAFYRYTRLLSLNEVGGEPDRFGEGPGAFHAAMAARASHRPGALSATATHDHKRGEDVRARLNVLSECPHAWDARVATWRRSTDPYRLRMNGEALPSDHDIYVFFQTLVGAWPFTAELGRDQDPASVDGLSAFADRLSAVMLKAAREAKLKTSWHAPDAAYEDALDQFVRACLDPARSRSFLRDVNGFVTRLAPTAAVNGLAQTVLKMTAPGVPDFYQGTEVWDLSLVDPDNRRPVDFAGLARALAAQAGQTPDLAERALRDWRTGGVKQMIIHRLLSLRAMWPEVFASGSYGPLAADGLHAERVIAFSRTAGERSVLVVVPRLVLPLMRDRSYPLPQGWADTAVFTGMTGALRNVFTGETVMVEGNGRLAIETVLKTLPAAVLVNI